MPDENSKCKPEPLRSKDVQGLKYFDMLLPLMQSLHDSGTKRDRAKNRLLHMDQYCSLVLLFLFNPTVRSLRAMQQASELKKVQRKLGCPRSSLGSLSEAVSVFEPQRLLSIIETLSEKTKPIKRVGQGHVDQVLTAVDGSVIKTLSRIAEAAYLKTPSKGESRSGWRLHAHFDIDRHVPTRIDITTARNGGKTDEKSVLRDRLEADRCYVMDRWFSNWKLFDDIVAAKSSYVCRIRDNSKMQTIRSNPLTDAAREAGVERDEIVDLGSTHAKQVSHPVRVIWVRATPHKKRGGRKGDTAGPSCDGYLRIATNQLDVPAEVLGDIYQHRWTIELFFRFLKQILGCRHLLSTQSAGIEIQVYMAIIACLLISLWTGRKPTLRTYEMICHYFSGLADLKELESHISKLKAQSKKTS